MAAFNLGRSTRNMISHSKMLTDPRRPPTFEGRQMYAQLADVTAPKRPLPKQVMQKSSGEPQQRYKFSSAEQSMLIGTHLGMKKYPKLERIGASQKNRLRVGSLDQARVTLKSQVVGRNHKVQVSSQPMLTKLSSNRAILHEAAHEAYTQSQKNINLNMEKLKNKLTMSQECENSSPRVASFISDSEETSEYDETSNLNTSYGHTESIFDSDEHSFHYKNHADSINEADMEFQNAQLEYFMAYGLKHIPSPPEYAKIRPQNLRRIKTLKPLQTNRFTLMLENL